jgi:acyl phosphate:glycerol-3-phosphate acyltransferase
LLEVLLGIAAVIIGYLLGSIPFAYIVARLSKGVDIRKVDTGNVGAATTMRGIGVWQGIIVVICDAAKGAAAIFIAQALGLTLIWVMAAGFAAFLGHNFPIYLGFKGGHGAATTIGIFLVLVPLEMFCALVIIGIVLLINYRKVLYRVVLALSVGSPFLPLFIWVFGIWIFKEPFEKVLMLTIFAVVVVLFIVLRNLPSVFSPFQAPRQRWKERT